MEVLRVGRLVLIIKNLCIYIIHSLLPLKSCYLQAWDLQDTFIISQYLPQTVLFFIFLFNLPHVLNPFSSLLKSSSLLCNPFSSLADRTVTNHTFLLLISNLRSFFLRNIDISLGQWRGKQFGPLFYSFQIAYSSNAHSISTTIVSFSCNTKLDGAIKLLVGVFLSGILMCRLY